MKKFIGMFMFGLLASLCAAADSAASSLLLAQDATGGAGIGAGLAAGFGVVGAGIGIGLIGSRSNEAVARQPEMAGRIFINMILTAALVEGVALFAVIVGVIALGKIPAPPA
jgi:F-type H+-transporting ATPase subunit c